MDEKVEYIVYYIEDDFEIGVIVELNMLCLMIDIENRLVIMYKLLGNVIFDIFLNKYFNVLRFQ